jgi:hypothetical protein
MMNTRVRAFGMQSLVIALTILANLLMGVVVLAGRESLMVIGLMVSRTPWLFRFLDKVYVIVFGLGWLMLWIWTEGFFSAGAKDGSLWRRFSKMIAIYLIALFAASILYVVKLQTAENWILTLLSAASLIGGVAILAVLRVKKPNTTP